MSLPESWVDRIFDKLTLVYGHQFLSRWDGLPLESVKADWARELSRFQQNPGALAYGLENLPATKPPTVLEFRAICGSPNAPKVDRVLVLPTISSDAVSEGDKTVERIKRARELYPDCGGCDWALALEMKDNEDPGKITPTIRQMYREVVANYRRRKGLDAGEERA